MNYLFILTILVIGLSGIAAQVLTLRELLVSFLGNELTLGIILANWIIAEALGVFILGRVVERIRIKNEVSIFVILQIIFSLALPVSIYLSRTFKTLSGISFGEAAGLPAIFYSSFLVMLPLSFCHGALFSCACKSYSLYVKESARSIAKVYTWETVGTICGGIVLTYLFIPYLNSFQIVFIVSLANLMICLFFFKDIARILKYIVLFLIFLVIFSSLSGGINYIHRHSINKQWKTQKVLDYRNSVYGNVVVTKREGQYTFFYNGIPIITTPYPDITFVQEFGNLPLLFCKEPKDILVISAGAGGLINEILKHPIRKVDYAELDPLLIKMLEKYPSGIVRKELTDSRVNIINLDGRFFVKNTSHKYDIVLIGLSKPSDLSTNRLFTQEFFSLAKSRLNQNGIFAFWLPGSLTYLSKELKDLNACILNGLKKVYSYIRIIPGDYNIILASDSGSILEVTPDLIRQRLIQRNIKTDILLPAYLAYRLDKRWLEWFLHSSKDATTKINQDLTPFAVFKMLSFWNKQFSPLDLKVLAGLIIFFPALILVYIFYRRGRSARLSIVYGIATTGFFGMLINLVLIFSFQVFYGYLYHRIGILMSVFMAGIALGSIIFTRLFEKIRDSLSLFIKLELAIAMFSLILPLTINKFGSYPEYAYGIFISLFFIPGFLMGLQFPLANKLYLRERAQISNTVGILYAADLLGGWVAGLLGGIILLPVLGLFNTCMVIVFFKISSLFLLLLAKNL